MRFFPVLLAFGAIAACSPATNETGEAFTANGEIIAMSGGEGGPANACFSCHGLDGGGDGVSVPRLAGLDVGYLQKQLSDYANDLRADPVMTPIARSLADDDQRAVAAWYAAMTPPSKIATGTPAPDIYLNGDAARGVVACASCHGPTGLGVGAGNPAISGQPAAYTVDQLQRFQRAERRNDPRSVMTDAVAGLTGTEMQTIAVWLERSPTVPPPATDAASASAARTAAEGSAASREPRRPGR